MRELSLNVMDIAQNSVSAGASLIELEVREDPAAKSLSIIIRDNGRGMAAEQLEQVQSPFFTTRTTRKVGLGIPLYKMACEMTGGGFSIVSAPGKGTEVTARFVTDHIDMAPLGDVSETVRLLVTCNPGIDFVYLRTFGQAAYTLDTREMRELLGGVSLGDPEVSLWLRDYLAEQDAELRQGST